MESSRLQRYHSLDALRAAMMLLGLVLHSGASYIRGPVIWMWPYRDPQTSVSFNFLLALIHLFRMPVFFVMAGFFAALLYHRDGPAGFVRNRVKRVLLPLVTFWPIIMPLTVLGFVFAARQVAGPSAWDSVSNLPPLQRPVFGHLWFLYDLLLFYAAALLIVPAVSRLSVRVRQYGADAFRTITTRRWGLLVLAGVTTITVLPMERPTIETSAALIPPARVLAAYGVFFGFGWLLFSHRDLVDSFAVRWRSTFAAGTAATLGYIAVLIAGRSLDPMWWHVSGVIVGAVAVWLLIFGITGAFVRYLSIPRPVVRYISDASYWMYLLHVVPITWCAGLLARSDAPAFAKFGVVLGVTIAVTVVTYHYFVRSTAVGELLNGRRYPRRVHDTGTSDQIAKEHEVRGTPLP
jgi:peptidoglycan/LPS O-acetylase OafA/YrhL